MESFELMMVVGRGTFGKVTFILAPVYDALSRMISGYASQETRHVPNIRHEGESNPPFSR